MNLKMMANKKVKAGTRLLMAEESVGELILMPVYPIIWDEHLQMHYYLITINKQIKKISILRL